MHTIPLRKGDFVLGHRFTAVVRREDCSVATRYAPGVRPVRPPPGFPLRADYRQRHNLLPLGWWWCVCLTPPCVHPAHPSPSSGVTASRLGGDDWVDNQVRQMGGSTHPELVACVVYH